MFYTELTPIADPGPCYYDNGGCSYLCLATSKTERICSCPDGLENCIPEGWSLSLHLFPLSLPLSLPSLCVCVCVSLSLSLSLSLTLTLYLSIYLFLSRVYHAHKHIIILLKTLSLSVTFSVSQSINNNSASCSYNKLCFNTSTHITTVTIGLFHTQPTTPLT